MEESPAHLNCRSRSSIKAYFDEKSTPKRDSEHGKSSRHSYRPNNQRIPQHHIIRTRSPRTIPSNGQYTVKTYIPPLKAESEASQHHPRRNAQWDCRGRGVPALKAEGLLRRPGRDAVEPHVAVGGGAPPRLSEALRGRFIAMDQPSASIFSLTKPYISESRLSQAERAQLHSACLVSGSPLLRPQAGGGAVDRHRWRQYLFAHF